MTITNDNLTAVTDVTKATRTEAVRVLSAAFQNDPVFEWWIPNPVARATALPAVFDAYIDAYAPHDATRVASTAAAAAVSPSGPDQAHRSCNLMTRKQWWPAVSK